MRQDFPQLSSYVHDLQELVFSERESGNSALPWSVPTTSNFARVSSIFLSSALDKMPGVRQLRQADPKERTLESTAAKTDGSAVGVEGSEKAIDERRDMSLTIVSFILGTGFFIGYCYRHGLLNRTGVSGN